RRARRSRGERVERRIERGLGVLAGPRGASGGALGLAGAAALGAPAQRRPSSLYLSRASMDRERATDDPCAAHRWSTRHFDDPCATHRWSTRHFDDPFATLAKSTSF